MSEATTLRISVHLLSVVLIEVLVRILTFVCLKYSALMELDVRLPLCEVFAIIVILSCGDAFLPFFGVRLPHSTGVHFLVQLYHAVLGVFLFVAPLFRSR